MSEPVHLFSSDGRWIAWYRPGLPYVWNPRDRWIGWFPWESAGDVLDPSDSYLGTVVGNRLLACTGRRPRPLLRRTPEPQRPVGPPDVGDAHPLVPPVGYADVDVRRLFGD